MQSKTGEQEWKAPFSSRFYPYGKNSVIAVKINVPCKYLFNDCDAMRQKQKALSSIQEKPLYNQDKKQKSTKF